MKVLEKNGQVIEGNFEEKEVKEAFWHTSAHVRSEEHTSELQSH